MTGTDEADKNATAPPPPPPPEGHGDDSDVNEDIDDGEHGEHGEYGVHGEHGEHGEHHNHYDDEDVIDPFGGSFGGPPRGMPGLPLLGGLLSASSLGGRLREILTNLRQKEDPSMQLIALQELSEILLVSNEDNLSGNFSPDPYVKELVALMQPNPATGEENPDIMLLACRCLANLMEALPASVANVVYGNAVPVLCQKLLEISFIDLAEQALSTLEKISVEYPGQHRPRGRPDRLSLVSRVLCDKHPANGRHDRCQLLSEHPRGLLHRRSRCHANPAERSQQQRSARNRAGLSCVSRIVESFRVYATKLEELIDVDMLKTILRLLLPGSTNLIGPNIHTQFLRVLGYTASASPTLATELFRMNVVETLYQILTGVSPPSEKEDVTSKLDSVLIVQALIHRPREQIFETLNVICNLLPTSQMTSKPRPRPPI